jgi:hypothetical protein
MVWFLGDFGQFILVEDGDAAQLSTCPFRFVLVEVWVDGLEEGPNKWYFPCWTDNRTFQPYVFDCPLSVNIGTRFGEILGHEAHIDRKPQGLVVM